MEISPEEIEIIGSWVMVNGRMIEDEASRRISSLVKTALQHLATAKDGWEKLYRDLRDGRLWELSYPRSDMQGGGPPALLLINPETAQGKYGKSINR